MTDLSRQLLASAREGLTPDPAIAARVKARIAATVAGTTAATATALAPASASASTGAGWGSLILKLGAALLVVGVVATSAVLLRERRLDAPRVAVTATDDVDEPRTDVRGAAHDETPAHVPAAQRARPIAPVDQVNQAAIEIDEPASLSREVELIDLAMASLRSGAPTVALEALATFHRETFGRGQMAEEAAAIDLEARCALHEDVAQRIAAFDRKWPSSAQRARITTACRK